MIWKRKKEIYICILDKKDKKKDKKKYNRTDNFYICLGYCSIVWDQTTVNSPAGSNIYKLNGSFKNIK